MDLLPPVGEWDDVLEWDVLLNLGTESNSEDTPEVRLVKALLIDAFRTMFQGRKKKHRDDERSWFLDEDLENPFSFVNVANILGYEPTLVRQKALEMSSFPRIKRSSPIFR